MPGAGMYRGDMWAAPGGVRSMALDEDASDEAERDQDLLSVEGEHGTGKESTAARDVPRGAVQGTGAGLEPHRGVRPGAPPAGRSGQIANQKGAPGRSGGISASGAPVPASSTPASRSVTSPSAGDAGESDVDLRSEYEKSVNQRLPVQNEDLTMGLVAETGSEADMGGRASSPKNRSRTDLDVDRSFFPDQSDGGFHDLDPAGMEFLPSPNLSRKAMHDRINTLQQGMQQVRLSNQTKTARIHELELALEEMNDQVALVKNEKIRLTEWRAMLKQSVEVEGKRVKEWDRRRAEKFQVERRKLEKRWRDERQAVFKKQAAKLGEVENVVAHML